MSGLISCRQHGDQQAAMVCVHVVESLSDGVARGFYWCLDDDSGYNATCDGCRDMTEEAWEATHVELGRAVCLECFAQAGRINGVAIGQDSVQ